MILRVLFLASCETLVINTVFFFFGGGGGGIRGGCLDLDLYTAWTILGHFLQRNLESAMLIKLVL